MANDMGIRNPDEVDARRKGLRWLVEQLHTGDRSACWLWPSDFASDPLGYGRVMFRARSDRAHRVAWMLDNQAVLPDDRTQVVLHECDVKACCNPAHLRLGTQAENIAMAYERGMINVPKGIEHRSAKLTERQVVTIRRRAAAGESQTALAAEYGLSQPAVCNLVHRRTWKHVA